MHVLSNIQQEDQAHRTASIRCLQVLHTKGYDDSFFATCRAPEPTDVWWENLSVRGREAWQLRLQSAAITIAVIAAGGVVQFYLAQAGEGERLRRLAYEVCCCR